MLGQLIVEIVNCIVDDIGEFEGQLARLGRVLTVLSSLKGN